ncbi:hypothetical protein [Halodesulfovibrio marinisediminis]|uniref:L-2-amino-thiazoline-4-carboxylic acid hydrolase n=1 Tax=Halodesulfovibrio marinisediminis DSM 17456 TaxID=1121457 RepID=A0A1N6DNH0_9BACT|nr:hypothetical protein [Halodesulfovibrio marinisediminis]SIN72300.1 hypothetical protein SAMN02745161_0342 [Halodesulfovibrio marinisediminis DSM 17456]
MHPYYEKKEKKLQKKYQQMNRWASEVLQQYYGKNIINIIMDEVTQETNSIIKRLPYIGGNENAYTPIIEINGWFIGFYNVTKKYGFIPEAAAYINGKVFKRYCEQLPKILWYPLKKLAFSQLMKNYFNNQAKKSQERLYPEDFVYTFNVDSVTGGYTFVFSSCAVHKHYEAEGANELKQFCNFADPIYSTMFNLGCNADYSFATGYKKCILSFDEGRKTKLPDNITAMIEEGKEFLQHHQLPHSHHKT